MHGPQVRALLGEPRADQGEVIVLHQHDGVLRRSVDDGPGEGVVHSPVGIPRLPPPAVETRTAGQVPQGMVQEPERPVGDHVVGHPVGVGVDGEHPEPKALGVDGAGGRRFPVGVAHGGRHPAGAGVPDEGGQARHHAACAPVGDQVAPVVVGERQRPPIGDDHDVLRHASHHKADDSRRTRARRPRQVQGNSDSPGRRRGRCQGRTGRRLGVRRGARGRRGRGHA